MVGRIQAGRRIALLALVGLVALAGAWLVLSRLEDGEATDEPVGVACPPPAGCPEGWACRCDTNGNILTEERDLDGDGRVDMRWVHTYDEQGERVNTELFVSQDTVGARPEANPDWGRLAALECDDDSEPLSAEGRSPSGAADASIPALGVEDAPDIAIPPRPVSPLEARTLALDRLRGWTAVPLARLERANRVAVLVWPAIAPDGRVVDDDIVGFVWALAGDGAPVLGAANWKASGPDAVEEALGGPVERVGGRVPGVPEEALPALLCGLTSRFADAVAAGDRDVALQAATTFSRLFTLDTVVRYDAVSELLVRGTRDWSCDPVERGSEPARGTLRIRRPTYSGDEVVEEDIEVVGHCGDEARWLVDLP